MYIELYLTYNSGKPKTSDFGNWSPETQSLCGTRTDWLLLATLLIPCSLVSFSSIKRKGLIDRILSNSEKTVQAQGGGQAIEDGAALGVLFDQLHDKETITARLRLFEKVRRNRASSVQILSNTSPPAPQSVLNAAAKYLPEGKKLGNADDINDYLWSFDVIKESKTVLA